MSDALLIPLIVVGFFVVFPLFWLGIVGLIGRFGWGPLAAAYPADDWPEEGYKVSAQSARIGAASYSNTMQAMARPEGLYLRPIWLFRFGHDPVFIPWGDVVERQTAFIGGTRLVLANGPTIVVYGTLATAVSAAIDAASGAE